MPNRTIVVLAGDQTGQELLLESLRVLAPEVTRVPTEFVHFDLSLANRRATHNGVVRAAAAAMAASGLGLKAATITPEGKGDVGSPNAILREAISVYDLIIVDSPPLLGFGEPLQLAAAVDGVVLVALAGKTNRKAVATAVSTLRRLRVNLIGVVLNEVTRKTSVDYYHYGYYGKYYGSPS